MIKRSGKAAQEEEPRAPASQALGGRKEEWPKPKDDRRSIDPRRITMKMIVRSTMICLAVIVTFVAVQAAQAETCNVTVSGDITAVIPTENAITVGSDDGTTVYGIPLSYLAKKLKIVLKVEDYVLVTASQCPSTGQLSACTLSVNNSSFINLPGTRTR
jgi:hypothetical protein